jgi:hypothetical protein
MSYTQFYTLSPPNPYPQTFFGKFSFKIFFQQLRNLSHLLSFVERFMKLSWSNSMWTSEKDDKIRDNYS